MELKYYIYFLLGSFFLLFIFNKFINRYLKNYKEWNSFDIEKKVAGTDDNQVKKSKPKIKGKYENKCREVFENIFQTEFPKIRPGFLRNNKTGKNMELDGYNGDLKLAFEYQGQQHYNFSPYFHKTEEKFAEQVYRDRLKKELCEKNEIKLVEIPFNIEYDDLEDYIKMKLHELGYDVV